MRPRDSVTTPTTRNGTPRISAAASHEAVRRLSVTDELTGVYNGRHFRARLHEEIERCQQLAVARRDQVEHLAGFLVGADDECTGLLQQRSDAFGRQVERALKLRDIDAGWRACEQSAKGHCGIGILERGELSDAYLSVAARCRRERVNHAAAADGARCRLVAHDEAVAVQRGERLICDQLHQRRAARRNRRAAPYRDACSDVGGAEMQMHRRPVPDRLRLAREHLQAHVDALGRRVHRGRDHPVAAADLLELDAGEIERAAFARSRLLRGFALLLDCAHPHIDAAGREHELVAERDCAVEYRARDYRAAAGDGESAIDRVAKMAAGMLALSTVMPDAQAASTAPESGLAI